MDGILLFLVVVLMVINFLIYHHFIRVVYFGSLGKGLLSEFIVCFVVACAEAGIIMKLGGSILGVVISVIGILLRLLLVVAGVCIVGFVIYKIVQMVRGRGNMSGDDFKNTFNDIKDSMKKKADSSKEDQDETAQHSEYRETDRESNMKEKDQEGEKKIKFCQYCGKAVSRTSKFCNFCGKSIE